MNRVITVKDALSGVTTYVYDNAGQRISLIDSVSNRTTWAYDANGRVTTMTDPRGNSSTYTYDAEGQLSETTDRNSRRVSYAYDLRGRQTGETWVSASPAETITSNYNAAGELASQTDSFALLTFTYDGLGRNLTAATSSAAGQPSVTLTATYDKWGNQVSRADNLASVGLSTYSYDNAQRLTTITQSFGGTSGPQVVFSYDLGNRLTTLAHTTGSGTINSVYAYDNANRLTTLTHKVSGGSSLATYTYGYDAGNRTTSESNAEGAVTYTYDNTNQLTGASGARTEAYTYDANGNRTMSGYTTDTNNRLVASPNTTYTYDAEGNMSAKTDTSNGKVTTYAYDFRNRLTGVTQKSSGGTTLNQATYTYDSQNRRIGTNFNSTQTWIVYDGQNTYADFNSGGTLQNRYLYGPAVDMLLARTDGSGTSAWYLTDKLGTVRDIANPSGTVIFHAAYDSYGKQTSTTGSGGDRYGYTGREYDAITGLQYNRARYYDATVGRWTQLDPIGFAALDNNLYRYVGDIPTDYKDPTGLAGGPKFELPFGVNIEVEIKLPNPRKHRKWKLENPDLPPENNPFSPGLKIEWKLTAPDPSDPRNPDKDQDLKPKMPNPPRKPDLPPLPKPRLPDQQPLPPLPPGYGD